MLDRDGAEVVVVVRSSGGGGGGGSRGGSSGTRPGRASRTLYYRPLRNIVVTYLGHLVAALLLEEVPALAQLALPALQGGYALGPLAPLGAPLALELPLGLLEGLAARRPALLALLLLALDGTETQRGIVRVMCVFFCLRGGGVFF